MVKKKSDGSNTPSLAQRGNGNVVTNKSRRPAPSPRGKQKK